MDRDERIDRKIEMIKKENKTKSFDRNTSFRGEIMDFSSSSPHIKNRPVTEDEVTFKSPVKDAEINYVDSDRLYKMLGNAAPNFEEYWRDVVLKSKPNVKKSSTPGISGNSFKVTIPENSFIRDEDFGIFLRDPISYDYSPPDIENNKNKDVIPENEIIEKKPYHEVDAINYSSLYAISIGPQYYKSRDDDKELKEHFIIGGCVDCLLTEPELFKDKYVVEELDEFTNFPKPQMKKYVEAFVETGDSGKAFESVGFKAKNMLEVIDEFNKSGKDYANYLTSKKKFIEENVGKTILSKEQHSKAKNIADSLLNNRFTREYFQKQPEHIEVINQLEIYWRMFRMDFKCKLDKVIIDHRNKTIQPIDIKTTGKHTSAFSESFFAYRYDIQASLYYQGICDFTFRKDSKYYNYSILPFIFIVESTKYIGTPLIYSASNDVLALSESGFHIGNKNYIGWRTLADKLYWHKTTNTWDYTQEQIENNGVVQIIL